MQFRYHVLRNKQPHDFAQCICRLNAADVQTQGEIRRQRAFPCARSTADQYEQWQSALLESDPGLKSLRSALVQFCFQRVTHHA